MSDDEANKSGGAGKPKGGHRASRGHPGNGQNGGQAGANGKEWEENQSCSSKTADDSGPGSGLAAFQFQGKSVRTVMLDGRPMFSAKDVCGVLGLAHRSQALRRLSDSWKGVCVVHTPGGAQEVSVISESGVYALAFSSVKPEAREFGRWVVEEVLPAVRRTGRYEDNGAKPQPPPDAPGPLPWDLPTMGRFIVTRVPGRPDHIHETELEEVLVSLVQMDVKVMAFAIKTIEAHWQRSQHFASLEPDGPAKHVCPWLERAILDAGRTAQAYIEGWGKKEPAAHS